MVLMECRSKVDIRAETRQFLGRDFLGSADLDTLRDDDSFLEKGIIDSTGVLELIYFVEDNFSIKVEDDELLPENLDSVDSVTRYVDRKLGGAR